jgi:CarD family transcriptional regulator
MVFRIGEKVVYPNQGVGTIENISIRWSGSDTEKFYLLRFGLSGATVMVPLASAANIGLRRLTQDREISRILSYLANDARPAAAEWKARFKQNTEKMNSGDLLKVAEVFKSLLTVHLDKPLSFREKKMLDRARLMLIAEISSAREIPEIHAAALLRHALEKAGFPLPAETYAAAAD